jgi:hypothetical protein
MVPFDMLINLIDSEIGMPPERDRLEFEMSP